MATWKINEKGEYKQFFGYTILSMLKDPERATKIIEEFLTTSIISKHYAPLPHHSYHMSLYRIFAFNRDPIPAIKKWMLVENTTLPTNSFLPEHVLKHLNELSFKTIEKRLGHKCFKIEDVELQISHIIKVKLKLGSGQEALVQSLREDLIKIYEYPDPCSTYHITLGYLYKEVPVDGADFDRFMADLERLKDMIKIFKGFELGNHNLYKFDSMTNYTPINSCLV